MASAVTIALPVIQYALGIGISQIQWIVNSYVLVLGSLILLSGALGDIFCAKRVFIIGVCIFTIGCVLCAISWSAGSLILFRALQGAGAALMVPGSLTVINRVFAQDERGRVIGLWAGISGGIAALGPFIGGVLADISWRWVFLALAPLGILSIFMAAFFIPDLPGRKDSRIDWVGSFLIFASLGSLSYSLILISENRFGAGLWGWGVAGAILLVLFLIQNARAKHPLLPPEMFNKNVSIANVTTFSLYFAFQGIFFLLSFRLQQLHGYSALSAGLALVPSMLLITLLTGYSGSLTDRHGPRLQMSIGSLLVTGAIGWWLFFVGDSYPMDILPGVLLLGTGMVLVIPPITKTALEVKEEFSGAASGLNNGASRIASLFAVALAGSVLAIIYNWTLSEQLGYLRVPSEVVAYEKAHSDLLLSAPLRRNEYTDLIKTAREYAFVKGFRYSAAVLGVASLCAALVSFYGFTSSSAKKSKR